MGCEACAGCGGTCCTRQLTLTPVEVDLLRQFAQTPFLPVASGFDLKKPVYLEDSRYTPEEYSDALLALSQKGLIRIDFDIALQNFDYAAYRSDPMHGSMALTGFGQEIIDQLEVETLEIAAQ